jgi:hypothetical protein
MRHTRQPLPRQYLFAFNRTEQKSLHLNSCALPSSEGIQQPHTNKATLYHRQQPPETRGRLPHNRHPATARELPHTREHQPDSLASSTIHILAITPASPCTFLHTRSNRPDQFPVHLRSLITPRLPPDPQRATTINLHLRARRTPPSTPLKPTAHSHRRGLRALHSTGKTTAPSQSGSSAGSTRLRCRCESSPHHSLKLPWHQSRASTDSPRDSTNTWHITVPHANSLALQALHISSQHLAIGTRANYAACARPTFTTTSASIPQATALETHRRQS